MCIFDCFPSVILHSNIITHILYGSFFLTSYFCSTNFYFIWYLFYRLILSQFHFFNFHTLPDSSSLYYIFFQPFPSHTSLSPLANDHPMITHVKAGISKKKKKKKNFSCPPKLLGHIPSNKLLKILIGLLP